MILPSKRLDDFVSSMAASWAASLGVSPTLSDGDPLLALFRAVAGQLLFIQAQIQLVNAVARAQTSSGADLDTFYGQFGFTRLPGTSATGTETFSKATPAASPVSVPAAAAGTSPPTGGAIVQTASGAISYMVVADTTQPNYSAAQNAYVLPVGATSMSVTVQALGAGSAYNVAAGQLTVLATTIAGIDSVTNAAAIANGLSPESDTAFSARFILWLNSLAKGTLAAIETAITGVQQGLIYQIVENEDLDTNTNPASEIADNGNFFIIVDDGSGSPPSSLITALQAAVTAVRAFTIRFQVYAPVIETVNVAMTIDTSSDVVHSTITAEVETAIQNYINGLSLKSSTIPITKLAQIAYETDPSVTNVPVSSILINGVATDLSLAINQVPRAGTISVS